MIIKTYEVSFAYGVINPIEKNPKYKGQISCILSYILVSEKVIETKKEEIEESEDKTPKFNW